MDTTRFISPKLYSRWALFFLCSLFSISSLVQAEDREVLELDESCIVNILNRTVNVQANGTWFVSNVPSTMGQVRARATCNREGKTISGETDYFLIQDNRLAGVSRFYVANEIRSPLSLAFESYGTRKYVINEDGTLTFDVSQDIVFLSEIGETYQAKVVANYPNNVSVDVTTSASGINYQSTNSDIVSVTADGLIRSEGSGVATVVARKDGVISMLRVEVSAGDDADFDGLPDDYEVENGLNPNDPVDAHEDPDGDGLSTLEEYEAGTNPRSADTDEDGVSDSEELIEGEDGFVTDPLLADTDGDGLSDSVEVAVGSSPLDAEDTNVSAALTSIHTIPESIVMTFNGIDSETSTQLTLIGTLLDGSVMDLTAKSTGTSYSSSDLSIASFGLNDGLIFGGAPGSATLTITNNGYSVNVSVLVEAFEAVALSAIDIPGYANNVDINGDYAFVAAGEEGLQVVDVSDRTQPSIVAALDTSGTAIDVKIAGNYAFIADGTSGLVIVDISNPLEPQPVSQLDTAGITMDLAVGLDYVFLANGEEGIEVVDISNIQTPVSIATLGDLREVKGIDFDGDVIAIVNDRSLITIDRTNIDSLVRLGSVNISNTKDLVFDNGFAHVAAYSSGFRVVDLTDPANPTIVAGNASIAPRDVALTRDFAFYAEQLFPNVVAFVNIFDPENAVFQGTIDLSSLGDYAGTGIALDASYAYITEESYVVRQDYGVSGNTKLFIAQYRDINDNNGVPPEVELTSPVNGQVEVEGLRFSISADASDDVVVAAVDFYINDTLVYTDSSEPYVFNYQVPGGVNELDVRARAVDLGGNVANSATVTVTIEPDGDNDGLGDNEEVDVYSTDPADSDSDDDGLFDGEEVQLGTDPNDTDSDDDGTDDKAEVDAETDPLNPDVTGPLVSTVSPANEAEDVPENTLISLIFNEALRSKSIADDSIVVKQSDGTVVAGSISLVSDNTELLFNPDALLKDYELHTVEVSGIRDEAGNFVSGATSFSFTTGNVVDDTSPTVIAQTPVNGAQNVPVNARLSFILSEPVDPTTVTEENVRVVDQSTNEQVPGVVNISQDKANVDFIPDAPFLVGRQYTIVISGITDLFGNAISYTYYYFTTAFTPDGDAPEIDSTTVSDGQTGVPLNAKLSVRFSEAINALSISQVRLMTEAGEPVGGEYSVSNDRRTVTYTPSALLAASSNYVLSVEDIEDMSGNLIAGSSAYSFTTGEESDTETGSYQLLQPAENASNIPLDVEFRAAFSERIDATTVTEDSVYLLDYDAYRRIPGQRSLSADGLVVSFAPSEPLKPNRHYQFMTGQYGLIKDLSGNNITGRYYNFYTGTGNADLPEALVPTFVSGTQDMPINLDIALDASYTLSSLCLSTAAIDLASAGVSVEVGAAIEAVDGRSRLKIEASQNLSASTEYTLSVSGLCDLAGNAVPEFQFNFVTSDVEDTTAPNLVSTSPELNATDVVSNSPIVWTFDENLDVSSLSDITVSAYGLGNLAGSLSLEGNAITFTPHSPYPANARIYTDLNYLRDLSGNQRHVSNRFAFEVENNVDDVAPTIVSVTPDLGAMDINPDAPVVITFSESLSASTLNSENIVFWSNGSLIRPTVYRSVDNRVVTLDANLPDESPVVLLVTDSVTDLSGNALSDFSMTFATSAGVDNQRPNVTWVYPGYGAYNDGGYDSTGEFVEKVIIHTDEVMDVATMQDAFVVAQNGVVVQGDVQVSGAGQVFTFTPDQAFTPGALIHVYLLSTATDLNGQAVNSHTSSFRLVGGDDGIGVRPYPLAYSPMSSATDVVLNPRLQVSYSEPLDESSINADNVVFTDNEGTVIDANFSLGNDGRLLVIEPIEPLQVDTRYSIGLNQGILDDDGDAHTWNYTYVFTTGADAVVDNVAPQAVLVSPPQGEQNVPVNTSISARYSEPLSPLSFPQNEARNILFSEDNHEVRFRPYSVLLAENTEHVIRLPGLTDIAGNVVNESVTSFETSSSLDNQGPRALNFSPSQDSDFIPTNSIFHVEFDEPLDPVSLNEGVVRLYDYSESAYISVAFELSGNGRALTAIPTEALKPGRDYQFSVQSFRDLAGNNYYSGVYARYRAAFEADTTAPELVNTTVHEAMEDVPMNAVLNVRFNESIDWTDAQANSRIVLKDANGDIVPTRGVINSDHTQVSLYMVELMAPLSAYSLNIEGIRDRARNEMLESSTINFVTATSIDSVQGSLLQVQPLANQEGVPRNARMTARYSERLDITSITESSFYVYDTVTQRKVSGETILSENGLEVSFVPDEALEPNRRYQFFFGYYYNGYLRDLANNNVTGTYHYFTTSSEVAEQALSVAPTFAEGTIDLPVNVVINLDSNQPIDQFCVDKAAISLNGGATVSTELVSPNRLTITPSENLQPSTTYDLGIVGLCDLAGNVLPDYTLSFTTSSDTNGDTQGPALESIVPADGATEIAVDAPIVMTFNEPLDIVSLQGITVTVDGFTGNLSGDLSLAGNEVTFTPLTPYPGSSVIRVRAYNLYDLAGNRTNIGTHLDFTTAATVDSTAPQVVSVMPENGASNIAPTAGLALTFSESMNAATLTNTNISYWVNGEVIRPNIYRSSDNRSVSVEVSLPANSLVTLVVSENVTDLSGNSLGGYNTSFTTGEALDFGQPQVTWSFPQNGSTSDADVLLWHVSEALDPASLEGGVRVTEDGELVEGQVSLQGEGRVIKFVPSQAFVADSLINSYLLTSITDTAGNALYNDQRSFRIPFTAEQQQGVRPYPEDYFPRSSTRELPLNARVMVKYSEALEASTINADTVIFYDSEGAVIPVSRSLSNNGRLVTIVPDEVLSENSSYSLRLFSAITDTDGDPQQYDYTSYFYTAEAAQSDNTAPSVLGIGPADGLLDVPVNAYITALYDEAINPLALMELAGLNTQLSSDNRKLRYTVPNVLHAENTEVTITLPTVTDVAGNTTDASTTFTTSSRFDEDYPRVLHTTPAQSSTEVPINSTVKVYFSEAINPASVTADSVYLQNRTESTRVESAVSLSPDGTVITIVPNEALAVDSTFRIYAYVHDYVERAVSYYQTDFTTTAAEDTIAPTVVEKSYTGGATGVPMNADIRIVMSEAIDVVDLVKQSKATLVRASDSLPIDLKVDSSEGQTVIVINPVAPLEAFTSYNFSLSGVQDRAGNALAADLDFSFTTGGNLDVSTGTVTARQPANGATEVALDTTIELTLSEVADPTTVDDDAFRLYDYTLGQEVAGSVSLLSDGSVIRFTPDAPLNVNSRYYISISGYYANSRDYVLDFAGNTIGYHTSGTGDSYFNTIAQ